ncbi:putative reverse transcriptase domain-containing protein [Tanacetum coccineum]
MVNTRTDAELASMPWMHDPHIFEQVFTGQAAGTTCSERAGEELIVGVFTIDPRPGMCLPFTDFPRQVVVTTNNTTTQTNTLSGNTRSTVLTRPKEQRSSNSTRSTSSESQLSSLGYPLRFKTHPVCATCDEDTRESSYFVELAQMRPAGHLSRILQEEPRGSFEELKQRLVSSPILTLPSGSGGFQIYSDASKKGLGCVLMQHGKVMPMPHDN